MYAVVNIWSIFICTSRIVLHVYFCSLHLEAVHVLYSFDSFFKNWRIVNLQCCVSFSKLIHIYIYIYIYIYTHTYTHTHIYIFFFQILFHYSFFVCLFVFWLYKVLVATLGIFSCGMWDPVPWPGINPGLLRWEHRVLGTGPPGTSLHYRLLQDIEWSSLCYAVGPCCLVIL